METSRKNVIVDLSLEFSIHLLRYEKGLGPNEKGNVTIQMLRSGTSIGANIREAQGSESKKDFVHKIKIAYKEAEETEYWLILQEEFFPSADIIQLRNLLITMKKVIGRILTTCSARN